MNDLVDLKQGFAINKKSDHYLADQGIPLLRITDLINKTKIIFVKDSIPKQFIADKKDIIFTRTGQVGLVFTNRSGVVHNNCFKVIPKNNSLERGFLFWILKSDFIKKVANSLASGAAQPDLNHGAFKSIKIPLPPLPTQQKIARILSAYDDLIENNLKRIKLLEEMAQITYEEWFVRMKFPEHKTTAIDTETGLPEGWRRGRVHELFELQRGFDLPIKKREKGEIPIIASTGITGFHSEYKVKDSGVVTGRSGTIGKAIYVKHSFWPLNTALWVKKYKSCGPLFVKHFLELLNLPRLGGGSAVPSLDRKAVHTQKIIIPTSKIMKEYEQFAKSIYNIIDTLSSENILLKEARNILLPRLMTGMIDVDKINLPKVKQASRHV